LWGRQRKNFNQDHTHTEKGGTVSVLEKVPPFFISTFHVKAPIIFSQKGITRLKVKENFTMKIMNPTAMNRYNALREAAGKIDRLVPQVRLLDQPPHENRENASVALEFPTPLVVLNSTIRQALSFLFCQCDTVQTDKTDRGICFTFTVSEIWITEETT
jgi:hypothetical protein